jgi:SAM-dependent methyltransferase
MSTIEQLFHAAGAYDCLAPFYDDFTAGYAHERWIGAIERRVGNFEVAGRRALDVACGTGKSTGPLIAHGYTVTGCDISAGMIEEAKRKFPAQADDFLVGDIRDLPRLGEYDLILCLDDAINYLHSEADLEAAFVSVRRVLAPDGVFVFDLNSLSTYRTSFAQAIVRDGDGVFFTWRGRSAATIGPGDLASAAIEVFAEREDGLWERRTSVHVQRHHPRETVLAALREAGLDCRAVVGQLPGGQLEDNATEEGHIKLLYFAQRGVVGSHRPV